MPRTLSYRPYSEHLGKSSGEHVPEISTGPYYSTSLPSSRKYHSNGAGNEPPLGDENDVASGKSSRLGKLLAVVLVTGLGLTAYGLGEIWGSMTIWPKEIRGDLKQGLLENARGDRTISAQYLSRAWEKTRIMSTDAFGHHPYLKITGVGIALAAVYEADLKIEQAYQVYQQCLQQLQADSSATSRIRSSLSPAERMRAVAISFKLGELAELLKKPREEEEKWLTYSVETVLKDVMSVAEVVVNGQDSAHTEEMKTMVETLKLPKWASKHDLAAPFEALGSFYSDEGKISYAMPLFLQAISILMPPAPEKAAAEDQCRAAQLMGNLAELILRTKNDPDALMQAESWAKKGLDIASRTRKSTIVKHPVCEASYAFMLYNLAMIRDMSGDKESAFQLFHDSLDQSRSIGFKDGVHNAEKAIRALQEGTITQVTSLTSKTDS